MPGYQPAMVPAPVPMMPAMGAVPAMPGKARWQVPSQVGAGGREVPPGGPGGASGQGAMCKLRTCMPPAAMVMPPQPPPAPQPLLPSVDPRQLAAQQQSFINQQALLLVRVGRALRAPRGQVCGAQPDPLLPGPPPLPTQAQQMTTQAMTLSLEQQTQWRWRQAQPQAQAPGAASPTSPPPVAPKPKKPLALQREPEREVESVGACLRARSRAGSGMEMVGSRAEWPRVPWEQEEEEKMPGVRAPAMGSGMEGMLGEGQLGWGRGNLAGGAAPSLPLPALRRPHRSPERSPSGPRASSRNRTISRRWVRVLGVVGFRTGRAAWGTLSSPGSMSPVSEPAGHSRESNRATWGTYRAAADHGEDSEASAQGADLPG